MFEFTPADALALVWFALCWAGYTRVADHTSRRRHSVSAQVDRLRRRWMQNMVRRDLKMIDTMLHSSLLQGTAFFASTSILLVGGLLAVLGATDKAIAVLQELPFVVPASRTVWEVKVLLLVLIFGYAFFKFTWCFRLFSYCSIMIGAAPLSIEPNRDSDRYAEQAAKLHALAGGHFNGGLRAYFFALAYLGWFLHPTVFVLSTGWVLVVLWRREFRSRSHALLAQLPGAADDGATDSRTL